VCSRKTWESWKSCSHSILVMTPRNKPQKDVKEHFGNSRNSTGFGDKSVSSHAGNPHLIYADNVHGPTAALIPVITRTMPESGCAACSPYYHVSKSNLNSNKSLRMKTSNFKNESYLVAINNRQEAYAIA